MAVTKAQPRAGKLKAKRLMRRAKRGRPFVQGVAREPNGRISRLKTPPEPADGLALSVRARQFGVSVDDARDARLATYVGRLAMIGVEDGAGGISGAQYGAAVRFLMVLNDYRKMVMSPAAVWDESEGGCFFLGGGR